MLLSHSVTYYSQLKPLTDIFISKLCVEIVCNIKYVFNYSLLTIRYSLLF